MLKQHRIHECNNSCVKNYYIFLSCKEIPFFYYVFLGLLVSMVIAYCRLY